MTPKQHYTFNKWIDGDGNLVSYNQTISFTVNDSQTLIAMMNGNVGIDENSIGLKIYPNPTKNKLHIETNETSKAILTNTIGQIIKHIDILNGYAELDMRDLPTGLYLLNITTDKGSLIRKIVKTE